MSNPALIRPAARRFLGPFLTVLLAGTVMAGCAADSPSATPGDSESTSSSPATPPTASAPPLVRPTPSKPKSTRTPNPSGEGDGDSEGDNEPATAGGGICSDLGETEVGEVLDGAVSGAAIPGGGCAFTQEDPRAPAANLIEVPFASMAGGMGGAKENAISTVEGDPTDIADLGDEAFVVTGTSFGGTAIQGAGAVRIGDRLISVNLAQSAGMRRGQVRALVLDLLRLTVSAAREH